VVAVTVVAVIMGASGVVVTPSSSAAPLQGGSVVEIVRGTPSLLRDTGPLWWWCGASVATGAARVSCGSLDDVGAGAGADAGTGAAAAVAVGGELLWGFCSGRRASACGDDTGAAALGGGMPRADARAWVSRDGPLGLIEVTDGRGLLLLAGSTADGIGEALLLGSGIPEPSPSPVAGGPREQGGRGTGTESLWPFTGEERGSIVVPVTADTCCGCCWHELSSAAGAAFSSSLDGLDMR
jgi:hypothetical protein